MPLYFDSRQLPAPTNEYVAWLDVMGIGPAMGRSIDIASNFVFKLHIAALLSATADPTLYPVMDGIYAVSPDQAAMLAFLRATFVRCAEEFINTKVSEPAHKFIIRGSLAFGPMIRGQSIPPAATQPPGKLPNVFTARPAYRDSILLGLPMVQVHSTETLAPPFGVYVHESARSFAPPNAAPLHYVWWKWGVPANPSWAELHKALLTHYSWCKQKSRSIEYKLDRIEDHENMANEYFK